MLLFIINTFPVGVRPLPESRRCPGKALRLEKAVLTGDNPVAPGGVKAQDGFPVGAFANGELGLVPVAVRGVRPYNGVHRKIPEAANPGQGVLHLLLLGGQLPGIGHVPVDAPAAGACMGAVRRHPVRGGAQNLQGFSPSVGFGGLHNMGQHPLPGDGARHEHRHAPLLGPAHAGAFCGKAGDLQFHPLVFLESGGCVFLLHTVPSCRGLPGVLCLLYHPRRGLARRRFLEPPDRTAGRKEPWRENSDVPISTNLRKIG